MWAAHKWKGSKGIERLKALLERCEENKPGSNETMDEMMRMLEQNHIAAGRKHIHTGGVRARPEREDKGRGRQTIRSRSKRAESRTTTSTTLRLPDHAHSRQRTHFFLLGGVAQTRQKARHDLAVRHTQERARQEKNTSREGGERVPGQRSVEQPRNDTLEGETDRDDSTENVTKAHSLCWRRRKNC